MKNQKVSLILIGLFSILIVTLFIREISGSAITKNKTKIRIGINEWSGYAPIALAKELKMFEAANLDVEVILTTGQSESKNRFIANEFDAIGTVLTDAIILQANGIDSKVTALLDYSETGDVIIANPKIKKISDLKNKVIGIDSLNSFSHIFVLEFLKKNGINENDVSFKIVQNSDVPSALKNGNVSASHAWDSSKRQALRDGNKIIFTAGEIPGIIIDSVLFHDKFIKENKLQVKKFISIIYQAQKILLEKKIESSERLSNFFKNDPKDFYESFSDIHFINEIESKALLTSPENSNSALNKLKEYSQYFLERGQISDSNSYKSIIAKEFSE
jgi:NitT/TauT family transport system substrate-binding protein